MNLDEFAQQIQDMRVRMTHLQQRAVESPPLQQELDAMSTDFEALSSALEAQYQQNQELSVTHQAVDAERQRYRDLFEFAPDAYLVTDQYGNIQETNRVAANLLKSKQDFLVGKPLAVYIVVEDNQGLNTIINEICQGEGVQEWEIRLRSARRSSAALRRSPETKPIIVAAKVATVHDREGNLTGLRLATAGHFRTKADGIRTAGE